MKASRSFNQTRAMTMHQYIGYFKVLMEQTKNADEKWQYSNIILMLQNVQIYNGNLINVRSSENEESSYDIKFEICFYKAIDIRNFLNA